jgi:prephenate dehydrogenase
MIRSVGIVGYGHFGKIVHALVSRYAPAVEIRIFSSGAKPDGKLFFSLAEVAACDAVVLCVPIHAFERTVESLLPIIRWQTILVDVATVKLHTVEVLQRLAPTHRWIATHPMFGPESFAKQGNEPQGLRIVVSQHTLPVSEYKDLKKLFEMLGFVVVEKSADEHDRQLAETLFLTHYVGQIITRAGFKRTDIDTVSFGYLYDAVESVRNDTKLFEDVYAYDPYCKAVIERFDEQERHVKRSLLGS